MSKEKSQEEILNITTDIQEVVAQMYQDDIDENPDVLNETFDCASCGANKTYAGSILYGSYRLCNDCVLYAELGFKLGKLKNIQDLIDAMEEKRLEEICSFIKQDEIAQNN